jgi:hypothetical protein
MPHHLSQDASSPDNAESKHRLHDHDTPRTRHKNDPDRHPHLPSAEYCLLHRGCRSEELPHDHQNVPGSTSGTGPDAWAHSPDDYPRNYPPEDHYAHRYLPGEASHPSLRGQLSEKLRAALDAPCLFYPGAGQDVDPAILFSTTGVVSTVIYADYALDRMSGPERAFARFCRHHLSVSEDMRRFCSPYRAPLDSGVLTPGDFGFDSPRAFYPDRSTYGPNRERQEGPEAVIGRWALFELEGIPSRPVLFLYFCTEAIQTYINLWGIRGTAPLAVVVQNHGKGLFWTRLDGDCLLYAASIRLPKYIYVGDISSTPWPGYRQLSRDRTDFNSMHRSRRALFEAKSHFGINPHSPLHLWDGRSSTLASPTYPEFNFFRLVTPQPVRSGQPVSECDQPKPPLPCLLPTGTSTNSTWPPRFPTDG